MKKIYHTPEEKREAQRAYDHKRQQTEHRRAYDRQQYRKNHPITSPIVQLPLIPLTRICLTCGKEKSLEDDFNKHAAGKYGYRAHCKECRAKERKEAPPRQEWVEVSTKVCPKCKKEKPIGEFANSKQRRDGHAGYCSECVNEWHRSEEFKTYERVYRKARRRDPEVAQTIRDTLNKWRREHPEGQQELTMRRNARKKAATTERVNYKQILERDGYWCYICERPIDKDARKKSPESLTFDHVIPLQPLPDNPQGVHCNSNIKPVHKVCNARKWKKPLEALTAFDRQGP